MSAPQMPTTVHVNGRAWHLFDVEYETPDGRYSFYIYALSHEHAQLVLQDIKETAQVSGQVIGLYDADKPIDE